MADYLSLVLAGAGEALKVKVKDVEQFHEEFR